MNFLEVYIRNTARWLRQMLQGARQVPLKFLEIGNLPPEQQFRRRGWRGPQGPFRCVSVTCSGRPASLCPTSQGRLRPWDRPLFSFILSKQGSDFNSCSSVRYHHWAWVRAAVGSPGQKNPFLSDHKLCGCLFPASAVSVT